MDQKTESPRILLILGSLFLMAYAAFMLGSAWMDSVANDQVSKIETPTPTPGISQTPTISPTSLPLYWITPTITKGAPTVEQQITNTPEIVSATPTLVEVSPTSENINASPTSTQLEDQPTRTPAFTVIATPTNDAYPGPEPTNDPYPGPIPTDGPQPTNDPYPGPGSTSTPFPTSTVIPTGDPDQPSPTLAPSLTPQPTDLSISPTPSATGVLPPSTSTPTTILPYSEKLIISDGAVNQVIWSQNALTLTLATSDGLYLVDVETLLRKRTIDKRASILSVTYAFNDSLIATGGGDASIQWWDPESGEYLGNLQGHLLGVTRLTYSHSADYLASASDDATVRIWDYDDSPLYTFRDPVTRVMDMAVSLNGQMIAASSNQHVHIWNPLTGELLRTIRQPTGWYTALTFSPDSQTLMTAYDGRRLEFWDTFTWERTKFLPLNGEVRVLTYSSNGNLFAIGFEDGRIQIWNAQNKWLLADLSGHNDLTSMAFSPSGDQLATSSENGTIRIWDLSMLRNP